MKKPYTTPEAEVIRFLSAQALCQDEEELLRTADTSGGIELPDDDWGWSS